MAGILIISEEDALKRLVVGTSNSIHAEIIDAARSRLPSSMSEAVRKIYGMGEEIGEDWADLSKLSLEEFNIFFKEIEKIAEEVARSWYDQKGEKRESAYGNSTATEIIEKMKSDRRFRSKGF